MAKTRLPAVAGAFYPFDKRELSAMVGDYVSKGKDVLLKGKLRGLVVPHAGYVYSGPVAGAGYKLLSKHSQGIERIILLGPSHHAWFKGASEGGFDEWITPLGKVKAGSLASKLKGEGKGLVQTIPQAHVPEHCLEVQLPFLQSVLKKDFEIFPLLCGEVDAGLLAKAIAPAVDAKTLVIASSDLSHYLPYEVAVKVDKNANELVPALDIRGFEAKGDACGKTPILVLMHLAKIKGWKGLFLDYKNSGDTAGDKSRVVGYGCYAFYEK